MTPARALTTRLPVVAALVLHAVEANRWMVAVPAAGAVLASAWREGRPARLTEGRAWGAALAGAVVGAAVGAVAPMPTGAFPVVPYSAVCGASVGLAVYLAFAEAWVYAWGAGFLAAILGAQGELDAGTVAAQAGAAAVSVGCFGALARVRPSARLAGFVALAGVGAVVGGVAVSATQGAIARATEGWISGEIFAAGFGHAGSLEVSPTSSVHLGDRVVLEVTGRAPDRLRLGVLDTFDGETWTRSEGTTEPRRGEPGRLGGFGERAPSARTIEIGAHQAFRTFIPAPRGAQTLDGAAAPLDAAGLVTGTLAWGELREIGWVDTDEGVPGAPGPADTALPDDLRAQLLPLTAPHVPPGADAGTTASALELYLSTEFTYSLTAKLAGDAPPLVLLLRDRRPAYCVYFASAMAAMLRVEGIPSRLVTGYLVEPPNDLSGRALARERDAHAWVEAWIPERHAWIAYDPTPDREAEPAPSGLEVARRAIAQWLEWQAFRLAAQPAQFVEDALVSWQSGLLLALGVAYAALQRWRQRGRGDAVAVRSADAPRLGPIYLRYRRVLRRAGVTVGKAQGEEALLAALEQAKGPGARAAAERFLEAYQRARFRGDALDLEAALRELERSGLGG